jgi:RNA polymerase sigma-70 factor (ECF subfamily)
MIYWQHFGYISNNWHYLFELNGRLMSADSSELDGLRALDPLAITTIHNRYYPEVYRFARFRVGDEVLAEDISGDVFMRLLEAVHAGRGPEKNLRGWLISTTANIVNDYFRKIYNHPNEEPPEAIENIAQMHDERLDPVVISDANERTLVIRSAIRELTDEQQKVIGMRFGNGFTLEETAELMGKKTNAIKALQFRALAALRRMISKEGL